MPPSGSRTTVSPLKAREMRERKAMRMKAPARKRVLCIIAAGTERDDGGCGFWGYGVGCELKKESASVDRDPHNLLFDRYF